MFPPLILCQVGGQMVTVMIILELKVVFIKNSDPRNITVINLWFGVNVQVLLFSSFHEHSHATSRLKVLPFIF